MVSPSLGSLTFLGTGEALSPRRTNTSYFIESDLTTIQVDCGDNVPEAVMRYLEGTDRSLYHAPHWLLLTHRHADHIGGIGREILAMWEYSSRAGVPRDFYISGEMFAIAEVQRRAEMDYPRFWDTLYRNQGPIVRSSPFSHGGESLGPFRISAAPTQHSVENLAYRFDTSAYSFAISGDGALTPESEALYQGVDLLIHEGFFARRKSSTHASVADVIEYASRVEIPSVAIVHVNRFELEKRDEFNELVSEAKRAGVWLWFPEDGYTHSFPQ